VDYAIKSGSLRGADNLRWFLLVLPIYFYIVTAWFIRPLSVNNISLAYVAPLAFVTGLLLLNVPRSEVLAMLLRARFELALALLIGLLSILSVINSSEPIRILRILFPSMLPILLVFPLIALRSISPKSVERLPRHFLIAGFAFACLPLFLSFISSGIHNYTFEGKYRYQGLFEHESQLSVMVAVMVPLIIAEIAISKRPIARWMWITLLIVSFYTLVRVGSKTALFISVGYSSVFYIIAHARFHSVLKNVFLFIVVFVLMVFLGIYGTSIVTAIDPVTGAKTARIFDQGVEDYPTIQARSVLWREALVQGKRHWLIGTGAGEPILGVDHAHNLILDYFRGIGIFGAIAVVLLCGRILWRTIHKTFDVILAETVSPLDIRILACFSAATIYVLSNQLSNSFGPATISALWMIYLPAVLSEPMKPSASGTSWRASHVG
jgi:O-antigen ligase